ncbi:DUF4767 domain-containing protein [Carnobacteriaceae bacterium zg-C25]|nr:DUF4767 domain-containing protein [Carnobacteriaceae bacterium zg-C25]
MFKKIVSTLTLVVVLGACSTIPKEEALKLNQTKAKVTSSSVQNQETSTAVNESAMTKSSHQISTGSLQLSEEQITKVERYRKEIAQARKKQLDYINSLPENQRNQVQSPSAIGVLKVTELEQKYPDDSRWINAAFRITETGINRIWLEKNDGSIEYTELRTKQIIEMYSKKHNKQFIECSPATVGNYYGLAVPNEMLEHAVLNGQEITFAWGTQQLGTSTDLYDLKACYSNINEKEVILFVEKDGEFMVLITNGNLENHKVHLIKSDDEILNQYLNN